MASRDHSGSITYSFKCGLRGFHVYKERNNSYDRYAIAVTKCLRGRLGNSTVGHLPREISRATRSGRSGLFVLVIDKNHRRSPLVQGGLEIPVQVTAEMDLTERNKAILEKYKQIVVSDYKEPGIDGHFDDRTKEVLKGLEDDGSDTDEEVQSNTDSEI
ncbi:unnamed protein product [Porites evermanni]|uniref:Uncharacterized protein n=1 Tax=Porites evermanni TaxID=104178 RepID=A0ABN8QBY1_9CNID|nr:unnamed protein product [Porites evermanni]